jgi:hypothetical protein
MEPFEGRSTNILKARCPLQLLATLKTEWWDCPLWAWTWSEIRMAHSAVIAHNMLEQLDPTHTFCHVSVSTDKFLALLPSFLCQQRGRLCYRETKGGTTVLIDPEVDNDAFCHIIGERLGRFLDCTDQAVTPLVCKKIFERYCLNQNLLMNQDYTAKINDLVRSTQREVAQTSFTTVVLCEPFHARETPEDAKTMDEVQNETSVAKMTQVERCTKAHADGNSPTMPK